MGYGNDCHSYPNSELSNNSWPILGSHYCLSKDKSLFCFSENFPWASGWQQGAVYRKLNLASRVEDSLGSHWFSLRAAVVSSEHPVERQRQPRTSWVWWRPSLWIFPPIGIISATRFCYCPVEWGPVVGYPPHRRRFCAILYNFFSSSKVMHLVSVSCMWLITQPDICPSWATPKCHIHFSHSWVSPQGSHRSLTGRAGTFNPVGSQLSVIPYPAMLVAVCLLAAGSALFLYEKPKSNLMSFLRLIFPKDRHSQETHLWYLLR